ncbi:Rho GTPase activation protein [Phlegmacium glaucopus]|nr:Rho GTPase activation protein [Phlegmacium glaucopus]
MPPTTFKLKQRLAALSLAQSSPSAPNAYDSQTPTSGTWSPTTAKRKFFNPPWVKRPTSPAGAINHAPEFSDAAVVQEVLSRMIFQAGVDFETRPMVVLNASALPDPQVVSYDLLLTRILSYLDLYVEADYTVVFFAAGGNHAPSWNWVWKAYRSLNRKYRKNLKQLYIIHSSFFSKMLFSLAGAIISPKFFRKLIYITTLSELAQYVPLTQIDIPPAVYRENLKHEQTITLPIPMRSSVFGVPLEDLMGYNGEKGGIPRVVKDTIQFLRDSGLTEEGLFRRSPSSVMLRAAQDAYDRGNVVSLKSFGDPHIAAVLLKKYLRDLPQPIFPESLYPIIQGCPVSTNDPSDMLSINYIRETLLPELVPCACILLSHVLQLLHDVSLRSASNRMDALNLAIVICPNLVKGSNPARDVAMVNVPGTPAFFDRPSSNGGNENGNNPQAERKATLGMIIALCIRRYYEVFDEVVDRSEAIPSWRALRNGNAPSTSSSVSGSPEQPMYVLSNEGEDEEDLDDDRLVAPIRPTNRWQQQPQKGVLPPSAWAGASPAARGPTSSSTAPPPKRHKSTLSSESNSGVNAAARSMHTLVGEMNGTNGYVPYPTYNNKAKSMISIENGGTSANGSGTRRGSITIGRGTTRKSSGAGVEAIGVTAEGFFSAPIDAPLVPDGKGGWKKS